MWGSYGALRKLIELPQFANGALVPPQVGSARKAESPQFGDWMYSVAK
jgi:hypothetical protein